MQKEIEKALAEVRPLLNADGGDIEFVEVTPAGIVKVKLVGACKGCPRSQATLKNHVEKAIRKHVPGILGVESVAS